MTPSDLVQIVAAANYKPATAIASTIDEISQRILGHRLMSIMRLYPATLELERIYSSHTEPYPIGGRKSKRGLPWAEHVLIRGEVFVGTQPHELQQVFDDHAKLFSLRLGSVINTPILFGGRCLGTLNLLHESDWYRAGDEQITKVLAYLLVPVLLAGAVAA